MPTSQRERKTAKVEDIKRTTNRMMAATPDGFDREREALFRLCMDILIDAGAYRGFKFTDNRICRDETRKRFL